MSRLGIVQALEACECSDYELVVEILLTLLEDVDAPKTQRCRCECGQRFEWPGLLAEHRRVFHPETDDRGWSRAA